MKIKFWSGHEVGTADSNTNVWPGKRLSLIGHTWQLDISYCFIHLNTRSHRVGATWWWGKLWDKKRS